MKAQPWRERRAEYLREVGRGQLVEFPCKNDSSSSTSTDNATKSGSAQTSRTKPVTTPNEEQLARIVAEQQKTDLPTQSVGHCYRCRRELKIFVGGHIGPIGHLCKQCYDDRDKNLQNNSSTNQPDPGVD